MSRFYLKVFFFVEFLPLMCPSIKEYAVYLANKLFVYKIQNF